jgi:hypothetical protein
MAATTAMAEQKTPKLTLDPVLDRATEAAALHS